MTRRLIIPGSAKTRWQHVIFWLIFVGLMVVSVARSPGTPLTAGGIALRVCTLLILTAAGSYVNLGILMPRLLQTKRYVRYTLALIGVILATGFGIGLVYHQVLDVGRVAAAGETDSAHESITSRLPGEGATGQAAVGVTQNPNLLRLASIFTVHSAIWIGATSLLYFGAGWIRNRDLEKRKLEAELMALRAQLNPHFLFNSLNNIYSLTLDKSELGPRYVLKLAELMRYILHDSQAESVEMAKELGFVRNYFELEMIRADGRMETDVKVGEGVEALKVAPLLFLPFIENAFKHGVKLKTTQARVAFSAQIQPDGALEIDVINNKDAVGNEELVEGFVENPGGVGLENVRRRLELLYPNHHRLQIKDRATRYEVKLRIEP
ncbi:MAG: histidine kinase [Synoicihabitans sp.]